MNSFQIFLLLALATLVVLYFRRLETQLWDRLLVLVGAGFLGTLLVRPNWSTVIAQSLEIGRGVDLLFYVAHTMAAFLLLIMYSRKSEQEQQIVLLTRELGLLTARPAPRPVDLSRPDDSGSSANCDVPRKSAQGPPGVPL